MAELTFNQRVAQTAITYATVYESEYLKYEYLVCSEAFSSQDYYIIAACADNYRHLIGVNTAISADDFFAKCLSGTLTEDDFDFVKNGQSEAAVKGSVRRKINALPHFLSMLGRPLVAQEKFIKNRVSCTFATTDKCVTVGYVTVGKSRPKTLLKGDELEEEKCRKVDLILRRPTGEKLFNEIVCGNAGMITKYKAKIEPLLAEDLLVNETIDMALV